MAFDDIPEDVKPAYSCDCGGTISNEYGDYWECNNCDFYKAETTVKDGWNDQR